MFTSFEHSFNCHHVYMNKVDLRFSRSSPSRSSALQTFQIAMMYDLLQIF